MTAARKVLHLVEAAQVEPEHNLITLSKVQDLCWRLAAVQDEIKEQRELEAIIRGELSPLIGLLGGVVTVEDFGKLEFQHITVQRVYDADKLDTLIEALVIEQPELAERLAACRRDQTRRESLRITRQKVEEGER